jgi:hypothetical protein
MSAFEARTNNSRRYSRRGFLCVLGGTAAASLLAACGSERSAPVAAPAKPAGLAAAPETKPIAQTAQALVQPTAAPQQIENKVSSAPAVKPQTEPVSAPPVDQELEAVAATAKRYTIAKIKGQRDVFKPLMEQRYGNEADKSVNTIRGRTMFPEVNDADYVMLMRQNCGQFDPNSIQVTAQRVGSGFLADVVFPKACIPSIRRDVPRDGEKIIDNPAAHRIWQHDIVQTNKGYQVRASLAR